MNARVAVLALVGVWVSGCLAPWDVGGPFACSSDATCPSGLTCDDGLCCRPDGTPACPTRPNAQGLCAGGAAPRDVYEDRDGDGFGNAKVARRVCAPPRTLAFVADATDCDDAAADIHPGAAEVCNGKDDNCDGALDEGLPGRRAFYRDTDGDGYGATAESVEACQAPPGTVALPGDCDDFAPSRHPGAAELCNGVDDDCDGPADEAPLADVQNAGETALRFPCDTGRDGLCAEGEYQCQAGRRSCVQRVAAKTRDTCNGLDDDCDGQVDEQPDCGGPASLVNAPGVTYGAFKITTPSALNTQCQKSLPSTAQTATPGGQWTSTAAGFNAWYIEAPPGKPWDLSRANLELHLAWTDTFTPVAATSGAWFDPTAGGSFNPVVYLCGPADTNLMRYRIKVAADAFKLNDTGFSSVLPLHASTGAWLVGVGSGFDTSRVQRIELLVQAQTPGFTIALSPSSGFVP